MVRLALAWADLLDALADALSERAKAIRNHWFCICPHWDMDGFCAQPECPIHGDKNS